MASAVKQATAVEKASTSRSTLLLLVLLTGFYGGHRFFTRKYASGLILLLTSGGLGLWLLVLLR